MPVSDYMQLQYQSGKFFSAALIPGERAEVEILDYFGRLVDKESAIIEEDHSIRLASDNLSCQRIVRIKTANGKTGQIRLIKP